MKNANLAKRLIFLALVLHLFGIYQPSIAEISSIENYQVDNRICCIDIPGVPQDIIEQAIRDHMKFPNLGIIGLAIGGMALFTGGTLYLAKKVNGSSELSYGGTKWTGVRILNTTNVHTYSELEQAVSRLEDSHSLIPVASLFATKNDRIKPVDVSEKPVADVIEDKGDHRFFILGDSEIQKDNLHLYSLKLPDEMLKGKKNLSVEATFVYEDKTLSGSREALPDIHLYKRMSSGKIIKSIGKNSHNYYKERTESVEITKNPSDTLNYDKKTGIIHKEFKVGDVLKLREGKELILAVFCKNKSPKARMEDFSGNYAAIVKLSKEDQP